MIFLISIRFLDGRYHGLTDNGERPEWPPSPFRLFQAIVAGNARGGEIPEPVIEALTWLEGLDAPEIIAPPATVGQERLTYVLNNVAGRSKAAKIVRPSLLGTDRLVEYGWMFEPSAHNSSRHISALSTALKRIHCVGWGIDLAIGHASVLQSRPLPDPSRVRFVPEGEEGGIRLRVPCRKSLESLKRVYADFLRRFESTDITRLESAGAVYETRAYLTGEKPPHAVFKLLDANDNTCRYPHAKLVHIAGMVRHVAIERMRADPPPWVENPDEWVNRVVRGKRDEAEGNEHKQFSYIPLPSVGHEHADAMIRNVMIVAPLGFERELDYLSERLDGRELEPEGQFESCKSDSKPEPRSRIFLQKFTPPRGKFIDACYIARSNAWHTITPVILDGFNRKSKNDKPEVVAAATQRLIARALARAGIESPCEFEWQALPFIRNGLSAHKYDRRGRHTGYHRPAHLKTQTAVHVRIRFGRRETPGDTDSRWIPLVVPFPGPLAIGAGRHCGFGLFAAELQV